MNTNQNTSSRSLFAGLLLAAAAVLPGHAAEAQAVATYFNRNLPSEANTRIESFAAAGHKVLCVAFPPGGGNRWSIVTDKGFFNRNVPTELHSTMVSMWNAGHRIQCVAFPPAGGNSWSIVSDKGFFNRNVPTELHTYMVNASKAGQKLTWVAFPPVGGNSWSLLTDRTFYNRNVPTELHSRMVAYLNANDLPTCVAFPPLGGNRWSVMAKSGSFFNRGVPDECHRVMRAMIRIPGGPLQSVAFDSDLNGFAILSKMSPYGLPAVISTSTETFSIDKFASLLRSKMVGSGMKYGFVIRYGSASRSYQYGLKRTAYTAPSQEFSIYDRFNPASVSKTVAGVAVLRALQNRGVSINEPIYKYLPSFWSIPASVKTITFRELLSHRSGFRGAGYGYEYAHLRNMVAAGINLSNKVYEYENVNYALARIVCVYLDNYSEVGVIDHGVKTSAHFAAFVRRYVTDPCGAPNVVWKPDAVEPTLFFPNPPGASQGTTYGDWTLRPGSAGCNISLAELSEMLHLMRNSTAIIGSAKRAEMDAYMLGWDGKTNVHNGYYLFKGGYFPGSWNGGAELHAYVLKFSSGVQLSAVVNGTTGIGNMINAAYNEAWSPKIITLAGLTTSIPNVTKAALVAQGSNLHLVTRVNFGSTAITSQDSSDPTQPYFEVVSSTSMRIHPPQGIAAGNYQVTVSNGLSTSQPQTVAVSLPRLPTMVCTPDPVAGKNYTAVVALGTLSAPHCWLAISPSNQPSVVPNIFNFGIGDGFRSLYFWPIAQRFQVTSNSTRFDLPSIASLKGSTWFFQALYATAGLPVPVSNVERVSFR